MTEQTSYPPTTDQKPPKRSLWQKFKGLSLIKKLLAGVAAFIAGIFGIAIIGHDRGP